MPPIPEKITAFRKFIRIRHRNQITLPSEVVSGLAVRAGDFLEIGRAEDGSIYLKPTILVTVGSREAMLQEALADADIASGTYGTFDSAEEFMKDLQSKRTLKSEEQNKAVSDPARAVTIRR